MLVVSSNELLFAFPLFVEFVHICPPAEYSSAAVLNPGKYRTNFLESEGNVMLLVLTTVGINASFLDQLGLISY